MQGNGRGIDSENPRTKRNFLTALFDKFLDFIVYPTAFRANDQQHPTGFTLQGSRKLLTVAGMRQKHVGISRAHCR